MCKVRKNGVKNERKKGIIVRLMLPVVIFLLILINCVKKF